MLLRKIELENGWEARDAPPPLSSADLEHDRRVREVVETVRAARGRTSLRKDSESHFVPNPRDPRHRDKKIDVRALKAVLALDVGARLCTAEPGVTFAELVRLTLPHGLVPMLVPELETITIGGAVSGCSVESMSHRYGGFHDSCLEYEVVTGRGEVLRCARDGENADIFEMIHGSYGTLGIITKLTFRLIPAKPFVRVENRLYRTFESFHAALVRAADGHDGDFVDAIVHGRDAFVLCIGHWADAPPAGTPSSRYFYDPYFASTLRRREDLLAARDYFFRYDADCHWLARGAVPGLGTKPMRLALGKLLLGSTNLLRWSRRLRPILRFQRHPPVVVDLFIPNRRFDGFFRWYESEVDYWPLWIVPYRFAKPYAWIAPAHAERMADSLMIDCAVYGLASRDRRSGRDWNEVLEDKTFELDGVKTLISKNSYDEARFWSIYDREGYEKVKRRTDPDNLFRGLYEKFHYPT
jgi:FAD/FMN-containing dehydrogenase